MGTLAAGAPEGLGAWGELLRGWPVEAGWDAERGRFVRAARPVAKGETVLRAVPYAAAPLGSHVKRVCGGCMQARRGGRLELYCPGCAQVFYCSQECLEAHARGTAGPARRGSGTPTWRRPPHRLTCAPLKLFASGNLDAELESVLRLVVEVVALAHLEEVSPAAATAAAEGGAAGGAAERALVHRDFVLLQSHHGGMDARQRKELKKPLALLRRVLGAGGWPDFQVPSEEELLSLVSRVDSNCFGMWSDRQSEGRGAGGQGGAEINEKAPECIGREVYIPASLFNHACSPNCEIDAGHGWLEVVTVQDVPKGEELLISYIDVNRPSSARRNYLKKFYKFDCKCPLCLEEAQGGSHKKYSYERSQKTPKKGKQGRGRKGKKGAAGSQAPGGGLSEKDIDNAFQKLMSS